ncbi:hypothetical protein SDC9_192538 [bioreactor metagenome]|uniref:Uncharacterized protein n=1 Tax=bioreactor metagenome TaxID=1076179 RepID=A0A645I111_9ZZZZ
MAVAGLQGAGNIGAVLGVVMGQRPVESDLARDLHIGGDGHILDANASPIRNINSGFDCNNHTRLENSFLPQIKIRVFMNSQPNRMP